jgi:TonB family protein
MSETPLKPGQVERPAFLIPPSRVISLALQGGAEPRIFRFHKDRIVIGTVISADVRLAGEGVSPIHAVIELGTPGGGPGAGATIYDLASDSGVFVNGRRAVTQELSEGDEITIGTSRLKLAFEELRKATERSGASRESEGRKLFYSPREDLASLILEDEREIQEIFDYRPARRTALEVVLSWRHTILDVEHFVDRSAVTIGNSRSCDFGIPPLLSSSSYPLVSREQGGYRLNLESSMQGVLRQEGALRTLDEVRRSGTRSPYGSSVAFGENDFAKVRVGELDFYLSFTAAPPKLRRRKLVERDPLFFRVLGGSLGLTGLMVVALLRAHVPQAIEAEQVPERIAKILYQPEKFSARAKPAVEAPRVPAQPQRPVPPPITRLDLQPNPQLVPPVQQPRELEVGKAQADRPATQASAQASRPGQQEAREGQGARARGKEGARGSKKASDASAPGQKLARRASAQGGEGRGGGASQVSQEGNLDLMKGLGGKIENLLGGTAERLGKSGKKLEGFGGFTTRGAGGLALSGEGSGGGGSAATALGGLSDRGSGGGRVGTGLGASGTGSGIVGGKARVAIRSGGPEETVVLGSIDADAVEAALLAHKDEFRLCYEREINAENPKLSGRVGTTFVIGSSGRVSQAGIESSSLKNANVERCVVQVIKRIEFPAPRGGGIVQVTYPFKFNSTSL